MPKKNTQAMKRHQQNLKKHEKNRHIKSTMRSRIKLVLKQTEDENASGALEAFKAAQIQLDKAARKGVIHRNNASRKVSRLAKKVNAVKSASQQQPK